MISYSERACFTGEELILHRKATDLVALLEDFEGTIRCHETRSEARLSRGSLGETTRCHVKTKSPKLRSC